VNTVSPPSGAAGAGSPPGAGAAGSAPSGTAGQGSGGAPSDGGAGLPDPTPFDGAAPPLRDASIPLTGTDYAHFVNAFMGTAGDGQGFPGAARPFGMIQWSLDNAWFESHQYEYTRQNFAGFSFIHYTGYGARMGVMLPFAGLVTQSPVAVRTIPNTATISPYETTFQHTDETARPGYYRVKSKTGIDVEMAVSDRAGLSKITWPASGGPASLIFDLGNSQVTPMASRPVYNQAVIDGPGQGVSGFVGKMEYRLYFVMKFDQPFRSVATFQDKTLQAGQTTSAVGTDVGAVVSFAPGATVYARVGLSWVSLANAQANLDAEIPSGTPLEDVSNAATNRWNDVLGRVAVNDPKAPPDELTKFYTHLYDATLQPNLISDIDGSYWGNDNQKHMVAAGHAEYSTMSAWDQGRGMWSLLGWLFPSVMSDVSQSYINTALQSPNQVLQGFIFTFLAGGASGGYGSGPELALPAQAYAFGARGFDTAAALKVLVNEANTGAARLGGQAAYLAGQASPEQHLDYSQTDFAVRQMALAAGDTASAAALAGRAGKWKDTFDAAAVDNGWTGYQWFKTSAATAFQPFMTSTDGTGSATLNRFTESCSAEMSFSVPQDANGLIAAMGGPTTFTARYDSFFSQFVNIGGAFPSGGDEQKSCRYFTPSNETDLRAPWLANWAGSPSHVQSVIQRVLTTSYTNTPMGIPGNNDWGSLSSWYVAAALGLYPVIPGVGGFSVNTPRFEQVLVTFENKHQLLINANSNPWANGFISGLAINGASWDSTWIPLDQVTNDKMLNTLDFGLQDKPSAWGAAPAAAHAPPSFGDQ
jgi:predicted alpha-1,2-mannosidase